VDQVSPNDRGYEHNSIKSGRRPAVSRKPSHSMFQIFTTSFAIWNWKRSEDDKGLSRYASVEPFTLSHVALRSWSLRG